MLYAQIQKSDQEFLYKEIKNTKDLRWYQRLKIVDLSSKGKSVQELSSEFDLSEATIRVYIKNYNQSGFKGLKRNSPPGNKSKIPLEKQELEELLKQSPHQFEKLQTAARNWTQKALVNYFREYHHFLITQSAISYCLKKMKIRWNRGKLKVTSPDPLYIVKRDQIQDFKKSPESGA